MLVRDQFYSCKRGANDCFLLRIAPRPTPGKPLSINRKPSRIGRPSKEISASGAGTALSGARLAEAPDGSGRKLG